MLIKPSLEKVLLFFPVPSHAPDLLLPIPLSAVHLYVPYNHGHVQVWLLVLINVSSVPQELFLKSNTQHWIQSSDKCEALCAETAVFRLELCYKSVSIVIVLHSGSVKAAAAVVIASCIFCFPPCTVDVNIHLCILELISLM